tara:strand:+ start:3004 stop:3987 length:984 start_codon:yes stop_codon:yes gene_type:complete
MFDFTFIDLFAGIGGFHQAMKSIGGNCVFSCEIDKFACQTYHENHGIWPYGDITEIAKATIQPHDVLCAGFPCQPFSIAGVSKKNSMGVPHGFADPTKGTLFFQVKEVLDAKRPKAFFLENVKNLLSHDKGRTFAVMTKTLAKLNYEFNYQVVDGGKWLPQHRQRVFVVGYDKNQIDIKREDIIIPKGPPEGYVRPQLRDIIASAPVNSHTLGFATWIALQAHRQKHAAKGNGFGYSMHKLPIPKDTVTRTMSARYFKDGSEILIEQDLGIPRKMTIDEAMQLFGFDPKTFKFPVSKTQAYKQLGNSVIVPAIQATAAEIKKVLLIT